MLLWVLLALACAYVVANAVAGYRRNGMSDNFVVAVLAPVICLVLVVVAIWLGGWAALIAALVGVAAAVLNDWLRNRSNRAVA